MAASPGNRVSRTGYESGGTTSAGRIDTVCRVESPEGIELHLRAAGAPVRAVAFLVDALIRLALVIALSTVAGVLGVLGPVAFFIGVFLLEWFYPVVFELARSGATPGKSMFGLQVVMQSGLPVTPAASLLRNLLRGADFLPLVYATGAACSLVRPDFRRLGDLAAGTLVVYKGAAPVGSAIPEQVPRAPVRALTLAEQSAILSWAARSGTVTPARLAEIARRARPILGPDVPQGGEAEALYGVAHWILGRRESVD